jgi:hypothetical protein
LEHNCKFWLNYHNNWNYRHFDRINWRGHNWSKHHNNRRFNDRWINNRRFNDRWFNDRWIDNRRINDDLRFNSNIRSAIQMSIKLPTDSERRR